jgi:hypothetical protein
MHEAFETLKGILVKALMLKLPDFNKDFEIHSNVFDFLIRGIIVQDGKMVVFKSKKKSKMEQRWPTHEKEMWAMIHCLKTWGYYIGSKNVVVCINNVTLKYFVTQPKLSSKQVRWQNTLALFNVNIQHEPGKDNVVLDVLSQKHQLEVVYVAKKKLQKEVQLVSHCDKIFTEIKQKK